MIEGTQSLRLGHTRCDFVRPEDFFALCTTWLESDSFHHVVTLNPEMVMLAEEDERFRDAIATAEIRVPDGSGLIWARWYLRASTWSLWPSLFAFLRQPVERVTGVEAVMELSNMAEQKNMSVYLLGGTNSQVGKTAALLKKTFPKLVVFTSPDHLFDIAGPDAVLSDIQAKQPAILLVAYGAPKQAHWITRHRKALPSIRIAIGVGGAFAILSEERPRAPKRLRQMNIEWLWRLILEPRRLPRIYNATVLFPILIRKQKMSASGKKSYLH